MATIIERIVGQSALPGSETLGYQRPKSVFGGFWHETPGGHLVWTQNIVSHADRAGDDFLRRFDEHTVSLRRVIRRTFDHAGSMYHEISPLITASTKRSRGTSEEIMTNVRSLSWLEGTERQELSQFYGLHTVNGRAKGIEALQPDVIRNSVTLEDIILGLESRVDRFQAYRNAARHVRNVHATSERGIGEVLANDIMFREVKDGFALKPLLNIPDIIYRPRRQKSPKTGLSDVLVGNIPEPTYKLPTVRDQQATDMFDFMMDIAVWECRRAEKAGESPDPEAIQEAMRQLVAGYLEEDTTGEAAKTIHAVRSFAIRGRLSLHGDADVIDKAKQALVQDSIDAGTYQRRTRHTRNHGFTAVHNEARLGISQLQKQNRLEAGRLARQSVIDACQL